MSKVKQNTVLPTQAGAYESPTRSSHGNRATLVVAAALTALSLSAMIFVQGAQLPVNLFTKGSGHSLELKPFYHTVNTHDDLCVGGISHSGYIGLKGDSEESPKRAFYWSVFVHLA